MGWRVRRVGGVEGYQLSQQRGQEVAPSEHCLLISCLGQLRVAVAHRARLSSAGTPTSVFATCAGAGRPQPCSPPSMVLGQPRRVDGPYSTSGGSGLSTGAIVGIAVGAAVAVVVLGCWPSGSAAGAGAIAGGSSRLAAAPSPHRGAAPGSSLPLQAPVRRRQWRGRSGPARAAGTRAVRRHRSSGYNGSGSETPDDTGVPDGLCWKRLYFATCTAALLRPDGSST